MNTNSRPAWFIVKLGRFKALFVLSFPSSDSCTVLKLVVLLCLRETHSDRFFARPNLSLALSLHGERTERNQEPLEKTRLDKKTGSIEARSQTLQLELGYFFTFRPWQPDKKRQLCNRFTLEHAAIPSHCPVCERFSVKTSVWVIQRCRDDICKGWVKTW